MNPDDPSVQRGLSDRAPDSAANGEGSIVTDGEGPANSETKDPQASPFSHDSLDSARDEPRDAAGFPNQSPSQDTQLPHENQAQSPTGPGQEVGQGEALDLRLRRRVAVCDAWLYEKEYGILRYVLERYPRPVYQRFLKEANEAFELSVSYRWRRQRYDKSKTRG